MKKNSINSKVSYDTFFSIFSIWPSDGLVANQHGNLRHDLIKIFDIGLKTVKKIEWYIGPPPATAVNDQIFTLTVEASSSIQYDDRADELVANIGVQLDKIEQHGQELLASTTDAYSVRCYEPNFSVRPADSTIGPDFDLSNYVTQIQFTIIIER